MQLGIILSLLAPLLLAQAAPHAAVSDPTSRTAICALLVAFVVVSARFAAIAAEIGIRSQTASAVAWPARYRRLRRLHGAAWVLTLTAIYAGLGWPQIVQENWGLRGSVLIDDLLVLLPAVASLLLIWWAQGWVETPGSCRTAGVRTAAAERWLSQPMLCSARHLLVPALVPLLVVLTAQDALAFCRGTILATPAAQSVLGATCLLLVMAGFPLMLRYAWHTEPLNNAPLRRQLRQVEQRVGVRTQNILVWHTGRSICNALVVGVLPGCRYVLLSDVLLERLSADQVAAIYGHELGHVRHGHMQRRMLAIVLPILLIWLLHSTSAAWMGAATTKFESLGVAYSWQIAAWISGVAWLYARFPFAWYCRTLERQADLCAAESMTPDQQPDSCISAAGVEQFASALTMLSSPRRRARPRDCHGWFHPSLEDRVAFVRYMGSHAEARHSFRSRMRRLSWLLTALVSMAAMLAVFG